MSAEAPSRASLVATVTVAAAIVIIMLLAVASRSGRNTSAAAHDLAVTDADAARYTCGMHPQVIESDAGLCPICRMDLVEVDTSGAIDPRIIQSIGVRTVVAVQRPVVRTIRTTGAVTYDETTIGEITVKTNGWIERMHADFVGKHVEVGDPLFDLHAPDLFSAQQRYLTTYRLLQRELDSGKEPRPIMLQNHEQGLTILQYYDLTPEQVRDLERRNYPAAILTFFSPFRGVIIEKQADRGRTVKYGDRLFRIADLDSVWVMVKVYESDLPYVHEGQPAIMRPSYLPGRLFEGAVGFIYPFVDELTRQVDVRIELDNSEGLLKPGMFADVELRNERAAGGPLIPRSAVLKTGKRAVVMLSLGGGRFEPRAVTLGVTDDDGMVEVTSGLAAGDVVVSSAQFLLDSESNFREALTPFTDGASINGASSDAASRPAPPRIELDVDAQAQLDRLVRAYLEMQQLLVRDEMDLTAPLERAYAAAHALAPALADEAPDTIAALAAAARSQPTNLEESRATFQVLSENILALLESAPHSSSVATELRHAYCPMVEKHWAQRSAEIENPYAPRMLRCGEVKATIVARSIDQEDQ